LSDCSNNQIVFFEESAPGPIIHDTLAVTSGSAGQNPQICQPGLLLDLCKTSTPK